MAGSPPRMRGKDIDDRLDDLWDGITPAYAGKRSSCRRSACRIRDHPRVCGEKCVDDHKEDFAQGSPPRMRGKD